MEKHHKWALWSSLIGLGMGTLLGTIGPGRWIYHRPASPIIRWGLYLSDVPSEVTKEYPGCRSCIMSVGPDKKERTIDDIPRYLLRDEDSYIKDVFEIASIHKILDGRTGKESIEYTLENYHVSNSEAKVK